MYREQLHSKGQLVATSHPRRLSARVRVVEVRIVRSITAVAQPCLLVRGFNTWSSKILTSNCS